MYEWYLVDTGEVFYVGKGSGKRFKSISNRNANFKKIYDEYKCDVRIKCNNLTEAQAFKKEKETIKYYKTKDNCRLTNLTDGGEGCSGWIPPQIYRDKQSMIHKKQWQDENYKEKMLKIRRDPNGVYKSNEFRNKISNLVKGSKNPNYGNFWSEEQKNNLRIKQKGNPVYKNENNPNAKKIICLETGEIFDCVKMAKEKYKVKSETSFSIALRNSARTAGGLHWANYTPDFIDEDKRKKFLISALKKNKSYKGLICLETQDIFNSKTQLAKRLNVTVSKINWDLKRNKKFTYKGNTYILLNN